MIDLSALTDGERPPRVIVLEWVRANREPLIVTLVMILLSVAAVAFAFGPFESLFNMFWSNACNAGDTFLLCSDLLQNGFTAGVLIAIAAPLIGIYLVNRQMALIGEALAHTAFGGVAIGLFISASYSAVEVAGVSIPVDFPLAWALAIAIIASLGLQYLAVNTDEYADIPLAVVLTGGFAVGIAVISWGNIGFGQDVEGFLYGDILFVPFENVQLMIGLAILALGLVALTHKQLLFITFDREAARLARIHVDFYDTLLMILTALVVVAAMQILGAILVAAMLVVPVAAAMQITTSFSRGLLLAVAFAEISVIFGLIFSYQWDVAAGPMIVLITVCLYLLAVIREKI